MPLIEDLIKDGWLKTPEIIRAFQRIKRKDFLPKGMENLAELNEALPIGFGQTISQPLVVAFMLEQLQPQPGDKILDIGSGSGWTTGLLADIVSQKPGIQNAKFKIQNYNSKFKTGRVIAIEIIPELMEFGKQNVSKYNLLKKGVVEFICADGSKGYPDITARPEFSEGFDKILASASAEKLPQSWKEQLKIGGRIVTPIGSSIWLFIKKSPSVAKALEGKKNNFEEIEYPGFAFVPLIEK